MNNILKFIIGIICLSVVSCNTSKVGISEKTSTVSSTIENNRPNIVYILADDLGIGDCRYITKTAKFLRPISTNSVEKA